MIRQLTAEDASAYRSLRLEALRNCPDAFLSDFETESRKPELFMERCLKANDPFNTAFGSFTGDELTGIIGFVKNQQVVATAEGEIIQLYVSTKERGKGTGQQLLSTILKFAFTQSSDLLRVNIAVVLSGKNAGTLYERAGFKPLPPSQQNAEKHNGFGVLCLRMGMDGWEHKIV